jgi:hypothetical protein
MLAVGVGAGLAACGDDDEQQGGQAAQPRTLAIKLTGTDENLRFSVPKSLPGGVVQIEFTNATKGEGSAQLGRVDAGHTPQEGLQAAGAWADEGRPLPPWVHTAGGLGLTPAGATSSATQELLPGKYFVLDVESEATASLELTGEEGAAKLPIPEAHINATEYKFNADRLVAGKHSVLFDNKGAEPHVIGAAPIKPGKTIADVRRFALEEKGEDPTETKAGFETAILDGGVKQVVELDLKRRGAYVLLCYVPDRKGGPPHLVKGMISQAVVR